MKLYIAEKPSLGRAIASALANSVGGREQRGDGFIKISNGDCVSWCIGHLLEQAEPHVYDPEYKSWRMHHA
jgi:DNA topoisomerase-3